jgi:hypothetical protein
MVSEGFMPAPIRGFSTADYGDEHLQAVRHYQELRDSGLKPSQIKALQDRERALAEANLKYRSLVDIDAMPGVLLKIDPDLLIDDAAVDAVLSAIRDSIQAYRIQKQEIDNAA